MVCEARNLEWLLVAKPYDSARGVSGLWSRSFGHPGAEGARWSAAVNSPGGRYCCVTHEDQNAERPAAIVAMLSSTSKAQVRKSDELMLMPAHRPRQAEVVAKHWPVIFRAEQPTLLQFRDHLSDEVLQPARQMRWLDQEPVHAAIDEPCLHLIDDLRGGTHHGALSAGTSEALIELADGELLLPRPAQYVVE